MKKPRKPLKRTPLKRSSKPIKQRSKKREKLYESRRPFVAGLLAEREWCEACPVFARYDQKVTFTRRKAVDVHELVRRSQGGDILDAKNCLVVCRPCHTRIGERPQLAFDLGLAKHGWER